MAKHFQKMIGGTYLHRGKQIVIQTIESDGDGGYIISTDKGTLKETAKGLQTEFEPVYVEDGKNGQVLMLRVQKEFEPALSVSETLLENIKTLKTDKTFIEQADAINGQAKTIIELAKVQLQVLDLADRMSRRPGK